MPHPNLASTTDTPIKEGLDSLIRVERLTKQGQHSTRFLGAYTQLIKELAMKMFDVPTVRDVRDQIEAWNIRHVLRAYEDHAYAGDDGDHVTNLNKKVKTPIGPGFVLLGEPGGESKRYKVQGLYVAPPFQGRVIETRLMHHAIELLSLDAEEVEFCVDHLPSDMAKTEALLRWCG